MERSTERAARNEGIFRAANEQIAVSLERAQLGDGELPAFLCECEEEVCRNVLRLTLREYAEVRRAPNRFIICEDHRTRGKVVSRNERYVVVEKDDAQARTAREVE